MGWALLLPQMLATLGSLPATAIAAALTAIVSAAVTTTADLKVTGGSLH